MTSQPPPPPRTPQETEPPYPDSIQVHLLDQIKSLVATVQIKQDEIDKLVLRVAGLLMELGSADVKLAELRTRAEKAEAELERWKNKPPII